MYFLLSALCLGPSSDFGTVILITILSLALIVRFVSHILFLNERCRLYFLLGIFFISLAFFVVYLIGNTKWIWIPYIKT